MSPTRRYQLHSSVLRHNSSTLARLLTEENTITPPSRFKEGQYKIRWRLELKRDADDRDLGVLVLAVYLLLPSSQIDTYGLLILKEVDSSGKAIGSLALPENSNGLPPSMVYTHFSNILGAFYSQDLDLDDADMESVLRSADGLIHIAQYLDSVKTISKSVDVALLSQGQVLFRSISTSPVPWMNLAYSIKSEVILRESLVHVIGNWNGISQSSKDNIHEDLRDVCAEKLKGLLKKKKHADVRLMGYYPAKLQHDDVTPVNRSFYSNDVFAWIALVVFRQWVGQVFAQRLTSEAKDGGFEFYSQIRKGGQAYLDREILEDFHLRFPMTPKGQLVVESHLNDIKTGAKGFVQELCTSNCQLDVTKNPVPYLTCVSVDKADVPWLKEKMAAKVKLEQGGMDEGFQQEDSLFV